MSVNKDKLRQRLADVQRQTIGNKHIFKPQVGITKVRIVPYKFNKEDPFIDLYFHYKFGNPPATYLSPLTWGQEDPIYNFAKEFQMQNSGDTQQWKIGKKLQPVKRTFLPIIVRGKEDQGVKFWGFGKEIYEQLLSYMTDDDYGDIVDVKQGKDIQIEYLSPKQANNTYGKTTIKIKPKDCPLTQDTKLLKSLLTQQQNLLDIYKGINGHSYQVLEKALNKYLNPDVKEQEVQQTNNSSKPSYVKDEKTLDEVLQEIDNL